MTFELAITALLAVFSLATVLSLVDSAMRWADAFRNLPR